MNCQHMKFCRYTQEPNQTQIFSNQFYRLAIWKHIWAEGLAYGGLTEARKMSTNASLIKGRCIINDRGRTQLLDYNSFHIFKFLPCIYLIKLNFDPQFQKKAYFVRDSQDYAGIKIKLIQLSYSFFLTLGIQCFETHQTLGLSDEGKIRQRACLPCVLLSTAFKCLAPGISAMGKARRTET